METMVFKALGINLYPDEREEKKIQQAMQLPQLTVLSFQGSEQEGPPGGAQQVPRAGEMGLRV